VYTSDKTCEEYYSFICIDGSVYKYGDVISDDAYTKLFINMEKAQVLLNDNTVAPENRFDYTHGCLRGFDLSTTTKDIRLFGNVSNVILPTDGTNINVDNAIKGRVHNCPAILPETIKCFNGFIFDMEESMVDVDLTGVNLTGIEFSSTMSWENVYGVLQACPSALPDGIVCTPESHIILGPGIDYSDLPNDLFADDGFVDITGVDFSNSVFDNLQKLNGFNGKVKNCPQKLPDDYICSNNVIFGPNVNITNMDISGVSITTLESISNVHGKASACPVIDMTLDEKVACVGEGYILGPTVSLDGFPLYLLPIYEQDFTFDLSFASVGDLILIKHEEPCDKKLEYMNDVEKM